MAGDPTRREHTPIRRPIDLPVGPPQVERSHHQRPGVLHIHRKPAKAKGEIAPRDGGDVRPCSVGDIVLVHRSECTVVG